jgi:hypothetical protein
MKEEKSIPKKTNNNPLNLFEFLVKENNKGRDLVDIDFDYAVSNYYFYNNTGKSRRLYFKENQFLPIRVALGGYPENVEVKHIGETHDGL